MKATAQKTKTQAKDILIFTKQLVMILFTLSTVGLGVTAIVVGLNMEMLVKEIAVTFAGVCTVIMGITQLYKALMER